tara:strand:+ start:668 stop:1042 length:375 start_codon:yes stop_codon:yes gene_type:complete
MKISKKRLVEIIKEECAGMDHSEMHHDVDEEGAMAKRQLHDMERYARELSEMLNDTTQLEAWVQAKLTKAADYLKTVKHYVEYGMEEGAYDQVTPEYSGPEDQMGPDGAIDDDMIVKMLEELGK